VEKYLKEILEVMGDGTTEEKLVLVSAWICDKIEQPIWGTIVEETQPEKLLDLGVGDCSAKCTVLRWIANHLFSLDSRKIQLLHRDEVHGHVVEEILIDRRWHMFDPTYKTHHRSTNSANGAVKDLIEHPQYAIAVYEGCPWEHPTDHDGIRGFFTWTNKSVV